MWVQLGQSLMDFEPRPSRGERVAAAFRQLLRAHDAGDALAGWLASTSFSVSLRILLQDLLSREPSWDSKGRWLDGLSEHRFLLQRPARVRVSCAMVWGLRRNVGESQWAEPFDADLEFTPDLSDLASYAVRFGDQRTFPGEDSQSGMSRIAVDLKNGDIVWAFHFRHDESVKPEV
jgi:hypothetical protein